LTNANITAIEAHQKLITSFLDSSQKDLTIAKLKNKQVTNIVIILAIAFLLILLFLLFVNQKRRLKVVENRELSIIIEHDKKVQQYKNRQRQLEKEKEKEVLDAKTREITSYSLLVANKNNLLNQIFELSTQILDDKENATKSAEKINKIIKTNLNIDEEWENFNMHFEKVHPHFFKKLKRLCSDLTEENLKMLAYIKMGMTTKQIAQLLNIAPKSVEMNRYRIKKKLKLAEKESATKFIRSL